MWFYEDKSPNKKDNSPANFNMVRKVALSLLEKEKTTKGSKNTKRGKTAINDDYRNKILGGIGNKPNFIMFINIFPVHPLVKDQN